MKKRRQWKDLATRRKATSDKDLTTRRKAASESAGSQSHKTLNQFDLMSIRMREFHATTGPWVVEQRVIDDFITDRHIVTEWEDSVYKWPLPVVGLHKSENGLGTWIEPENADFIANARTDVPNMLATLDVFAHHRVYDALLRFYRSGDCPAEDREAIERALDVSWSLMKSRTNSEES